MNTAEEQIAGAATELLDSCVAHIRGMTMAKRVPPEQMTIQQIQAEIDQAFQQWNDIACNGCQDPGWPDGTNMDLVRNHIIFWYRVVDEKRRADKQLSFLMIRTMQRCEGRFRPKFQLNIWSPDACIPTV